MKLALALGFVFLASACVGRSLEGPSDGSVDLVRPGVDINDCFGDLAGPPFDLAGASVDLASSGTQSCAAIVTCAVGCTAQSCIDACVALGTSTAAAEFNAIFGCAYAQCTPSASGNPASCSSDADTSPTCETCLTQAASGSSCAMFVEACING